MKLVYGVFDDLGPATAARDELQEHAEASEREQEAASVAMHQHDIQPNDLPRAGTIAWQAGLGGALLVGGTIAILLTLLANDVFQIGIFDGIGGPPNLTGSSPIGIVVLSFGAALFGGLLAALAGRAGNRARVRKLEDAVAEGKVLLTLSAPRRRVRPILEMMARAGAKRTGTI